MEKSRSTFHILLNLFLPYMVLMVFSTLSSLVLYTQSLKIAEEQIRQKNTFLLREIQTSMTSFLEDSNKLFSHLIYQSSHIDLPRGGEGLSKKEISLDLYRVEALKNMPPVDIYQEFILDYYILLESPPVILNSEMSLPLETYLKYSLSLNGKEREETGAYFFNNRGTAHYFTDILSLRPSPERQGLVYQKGMIRKFGSDYGGLKGLVIIYMNTENYYRELEKIDISLGGGIFTLDGKGNIEFGLAQGGPCSEILEKGVLPPDGWDELKTEKSWFATEVEPDDHPFRTVAVQSRDYLREQTKGVRRFLISLISLLILIGLMFSLMVVYFNSKPIGEIFLEVQKKNVLEREAPDKSPIRNGLFSRLNFQVQELSHYMEEQRQHLEHNVMERLLNGYFISDGDYQNIVEFNLCGEAKGYTVILFSIRSISAGLAVGEIREEGLWKSRLKILIRSRLADGSFYAYDRNPGEIIVIFQEYHDRGPDIQEFIEPLSKSIIEKDLFETIISIGGTVTAIEQISLSYEQAVRARDTYRWDDRSYILRFARRDSSSSLLNRPVDLEKKLTNSIISGDSPTLKKLFDEIYEKNLRLTNVSYKHIRILIDSIMSVLMDIMQRFNLEDRELEESIAGIIGEDISLKNYRELYERLEGIMIRIADYRTSTQNHRKSLMVREMCDLMVKNFSDPFLSADAVGDALGISGNYVYKLFKEYYGTSFHRYLEKLRMDHAKKLLEGEPGMNIKEIASESGYNSINTFYKAFRKYFNMSAGDFRKNCRPLPKEEMPPIL